MLPGIMRALTFHDVHDVRFAGAPDPAIEDPRDAIVQVERTTVCGSDLHVWHGREAGIDAGTVMGHECVGRVVAAGDAVKRLAPGHRVVAAFSSCCGECFYCRHQLSARCEHGRLFGWVQNGVGLHGMQAAHVRVPFAEATLMAVPDDLPPELAMLLADVLPTGWHAAQGAAIAHDSVVVVLGCGPVGLMAVACARELGAAQVLAVDAVAERRAMAERFGAVGVPLDDVARAVRQATAHRGADAVLEAVGSPAAARLAFDLLRPGGVISIAGVHHEAQFGFSPAQAYDRNVTLRIGRCPARSLMDGLLPLARRRPDLASIVTHTLPLSDGAAAYTMFDRKQDGCIKLALVP